VIVPKCVYLNEQISVNYDCIQKVSTVLILHADIMLSHRPRARNQA